MAGRKSKYKEEFNEQAEKLCSIFGADDKKLAKYFKTTVTTLNNWKKKHPSFLEALKRGKEVFDTNVVERALWERAVGYEHDAEQVFCFKGKVIVHKQTKRYPPDPTCLIFWLKNRNRERWKDIKADDGKGRDDDDQEFDEYEVWKSKQMPD